MNNECENCIYYLLEADMSGSGYYVCDNRNYKSSWPEFTGKCSYFELKSNIKNKEDRDE